VNAVEAVSCSHHDDDDDGSRTNGSSPSSGRKV